MVVKAGIFFFLKQTVLVAKVVRRPCERPNLESTLLAKQNKTKQNKTHTRKLIVESRIVVVCCESLSGLECK